MYDMKTLKEDLHTLIQVKDGPCTSVYLPTHRYGPETQQDPILLKNLLRKAEKDLATLGHRSTEARQFLEPANALVDDGGFWRQQGEGLALFISNDLFRAYRLPSAVEELMVVTDRFHLKPVIRLLNLEHRFYVLAVGQKTIKLLRCTHFEWEEVDLGEDVPTTLDEALKYDEPEAQLRFHTIAQGSAVRGVTMFHGQGVGIDESKTNIWRFFLKVGEGVSRVLGSSTDPLVLVGLDHLMPIYREANRYPHLLQESVTGNPETLRLEEIHREAREIALRHFRTARRADASKYGQYAGTGMASDDVEEIVPAAYFGRVDRLFVPLGEHIWGSFSPDTHSVQMHKDAKAGDADLMDLAATRTLAQGGEVYVMEKADGIPGAGPVAALFRY